jgi:hypothetical protein
MFGGQSRAPDRLRSRPRHPRAVSATRLRGQSEPITQNDLKEERPSCIKIRQCFGIVGERAERPLSGVRPARILVAPASSVRALNWARRASGFVAESPRTSVCPSIDVRRLRLTSRTNHRGRRTAADSTALRPRMVRTRVGNRPAPHGWAWTSSVSNGKVGAQSCVDHAD